MSRRPSFLVTTLALSVLTLIALLASWLKPKVPLPDRNGLGNEAASFLIQGSRERLDWHILAPSAFAEARRLDRPVFLLIGGAWSEIGRRFDRDIFSASDIQNYLSREFVCIRVDADEHPEWLSAFWPLHRADFGILPGFQIWILDPRGRALDFIGRNDASVSADRPSFLRELIDVKRRAREAMTGDATEAQSIQSEDIAQIGKGTKILPNVAGYADAIAQLIDSTHGGFPRGDLQNLYPEAWRLQLLLGRYAEWASSSEPAFQSGIVDLLDGGFFRLARSVDFRKVELDKITVVNASMLRTLAIANAMTDDKFDRWQAERTFDYLADATTGGYFVSCLPAESGLLDRSARSSFQPRRLRELISNQSDRDWAVQALNLDVRKFPQALPALSDLNIPFDSADQFGRVMTKFRESAGKQVFAGDSYLDVNGYVTARMLECARMWGDQDRMARATSMVDKLEAFRNGDDVAHGLIGRSRSLVYLGDYLAYADAALQDYLAEGRVPTLLAGLKVLQRALFLFQDKNAGELYPVPPADVSGPYEFTKSPEIMDTLRESTTAQAIRLCLDYGRLFGGQMQGPLRAFAEASLKRFALVAARSTPSLGGFYCAAASFADDRFAIAVGPNAQSLADKLYALRPERFVAAAFGPVRPELRGKAPGVYIVSGKGFVGPLAVDRAAEALGRSLKP